MGDPLLVWNLLTRERMGSVRQEITEETEGRLSRCLKWVGRSVGWETRGIGRKRTQRSQRGKPQPNPPFPEARAEAQRAQRGIAATKVAGRRAFW